MFVLQAILGDRVLYEEHFDCPKAAREAGREWSADPTSEADRVRLLTVDGELEAAWGVGSPSGYTACPCCGMDTVSSSVADPELCSDCEESGCERDGSEPACDCD